MAIARIGTPGQINLPSGDSGSGSATVEAGCDLFIACATAWRSETPWWSTATVTIDGAAMTLAIQSVNVSYFQAAIFYKLTPASSGSKTFAWSWPVGHGPGGTDGGKWVYASYSGVDQTAPIRDSELIAANINSTTPATTPTISSLANDLIVAWAGFYAGGVDRTYVFSNATSVYQTTKTIPGDGDGDGALAEAVATGSQTVSVHNGVASVEDGHLMAVALKPATVVVPADTFAIASDADDGDGERHAGTWAGVSSGTYSASDTTPMNISKSFFTSNYYVHTMCLRWDTSSIPDDATIVSANLLLYVVDKADTDVVTYAADYYDFGGEPSVAADWEQYSSGDCISSIAASSLTVGAVNTIPLTGLAGINKTGITGIRIALKSTETTAPVNDNFVEFAAYEDTTNQEPRLQVTTASTGFIFYPKII